MTAVGAEDRPHKLSHVSGHGDPSWAIWCISRVEHGSAPFYAFPTQCLRGSRITRFQKSSVDTKLSAGIKGGNFHLFLSFPLSLFEYSNTLFTFLRIKKDYTFLSTLFTTTSAHSTTGVFFLVGVVTFYSQCVFHNKCVYS